MTKLLFQAYIEPAQFNWLTKKAKELKRSKASIVREAIQFYKREEEKKKEDK